MKHKTIFIGALSLLLIGAGCTGGADVDVEEKDDVVEEQMHMMEEEDAASSDSNEEVSIEVNIPEPIQEDDSQDVSDSGDEAAPAEPSEEVFEQETAPEAAQVRVVNITGRNFEFSETEIRVSVGDTVRINFTSESGFHDWTLDEFDAATSRVSSGGSTSVEFVASKAGSFEYYCSVGSHRQLGMVGTLIVE